MSGKLYGANGKALGEQGSGKILSASGLPLTRGSNLLTPDAPNSTPSSGDVRVSNQDVWEAKERLKGRAKAYPRRRRTGLTDFLRMAVFWGPLYGNFAPAGHSLEEGIKADMHAIRPLLEAIQ